MFKIIGIHFKCTYVTEHLPKIICAKKKKKFGKNFFWEKYSLEVLFMVLANSFDH